MHSGEGERRARLCARLLDAHSVCATGDIGKQSEKHPTANWKWLDRDRPRCEEPSAASQLVLAPTRMKVDRADTTKSRSRCFLFALVRTLLVLPFLSFSVSSVSSSCTRNSWNIAYHYKKWLRNKLSMNIFPLDTSHRSRPLSFSFYLLFDGFRNSDWPMVGALTWKSICLRHIDFLKKMMTGMNQKNCSETPVVMSAVRWPWIFISLFWLWRLFFLLNFLLQN